MTMEDKAILLRLETIYTQIAELYHEYDEPECTQRKKIKAFEEQSRLSNEAKKLELFLS